MSDFKIQAYRSKGIPDVYILNTAAVVGEIVFMQIFANTLTTYNRSVISYSVDMGAAGSVTSGESKVLIQVNAAGIYFPILTIGYSDGTRDTFELKQAIRVYKEWPSYDPTRYRVLDDISSIELPYSKEDVSIKPNEFGISDVINAAFIKLYKCIEYVTAQTRALASTTPTEYVGWLGCHSKATAKGVRWNTSNNFPDVSSDYMNSTVYNRLQEFNNLIDIKLVGDEMYIISKDIESKNINIMIGSIERDFTPVIFDTIHTALGNIKTVSCMSVSIIDATRRAIYIADNLSNKIFKLIVDISSVSIDVEQAVGGYGSRQEPTKFYSVNHVDIVDDKIYCVDFNNKCIKILNSNLGYLKTIYLPEFDDNAIISTCASLNIDSTPVIFALTETKRIYILSENGTVYNSNVPFYDLHQIDSADEPLKVILDYGGDFLYVLCSNSVHKYSVAGLYIGKLQLLPNSNFKSITTDVYRNIYVVQDRVIHKMLDVVESLSISREGFNNSYIPLKEVLLEENNLNQDWIINASLLKIATNIDLLHRSIHSKFGFIKTNTKYGTKIEFVTAPVSQINLPACIDVRNVGVGTNELSLAQVYNRDIHKMYDCLYNILLSTKAVYASGADKEGLCKDSFCWSWKSTKCSTFNVPFVRVCDINPVTFAELQADKLGGYNLNKRWIDAFSSCCTGTPEPPQQQQPTQDSRDPKY